MIRRRFLGLMTMAGATGVAALTKAANAGEARSTAVYKVTGFTCITCATGLETLLGREQGVLAVKASYPEAIATVSFQPKITTVTKLGAAIESMGFHAELIPSSHS